MKVTFRHSSAPAGQIMKRLKNFSIKAGWFENAKYSDNKPVAGIAAVQDGGATINHPGGTPYKFGKNGEVVFVKKDTPNPAGITKPHTIVIPPRPFMKPSVEDNKEDFVGQIEIISRQFLKGEISEQKAADKIGEAAAGNIKKAIAKVNAPPLKASTVRRKRNQYADKSVTGALTKPLIGSGHLLESVDSKAELT
jgi:hypothetical protein